jgi:hypothetical protein
MLSSTAKPCLVCDKPAGLRCLSVASASKPEDPRESPKIHILGETISKSGGSNGALSEGFGADARGRRINCH